VSEETSGDLGSTPPHCRGDSHRHGHSMGAARPLSSGTPDLSFSSDSESSLSHNEVVIPIAFSPPPSLSPRPTLPALITKDLDLLKPLPHPSLRDSLAFSLLSSSPSPASPQPPTPRTAKRKRLTKLRRFLGESIPAEAVYSPSSPLQQGQLLEANGEDDEKNRHIRAAIVVGKILEMETDDEDSEDSSDADAGSDLNDYDDNDDEYFRGVKRIKEKKDDCSRMLENGIVFRLAGKRRFSRKWMHDKGNKRWEEPDYQNVIRALRAL